MNSGPSGLSFSLGFLVLVCTCGVTALRLLKQHSLMGAVKLSSGAQGVTRQREVAEVRAFSVEFFSEAGQSSGL